MWIRGIDFLYTRLVLLDFVARIAPGAAAVTAAYLLFAGWGPFGVGELHPYTPVSIWGSLPLVAFMWLLGFALVATARLVRYAKREIPAGVPTNEWARILILFDRIASDSEKLRSERLYLVSEASAAGGIALLLVALSMFFRPPGPVEYLRNRWLMIGMFLGAIWGLAAVHRDYLARWHRHVRATIELDQALHPTRPSINTSGDFV